MPRSWAGLSPDLGTRQEGAGKSDVYSASWQRYSAKRDGCGNVATTIAIYHTTPGEKAPGSQKKKGDPLRCAGVRSCWISWLTRILMEIQSLNRWWQRCHHRRKKSLIKVVVGGYLLRGETTGIFLFKKFSIKVSEQFCFGECTSRVKLKNDSWSLLRQTPGGLGFQPAGNVVLNSAPHRATLLVPQAPAAATTRVTTS